MQFPKTTDPHLHILSISNQGNTYRYPDKTCFAYNENDITINYLGISYRKPISKAFYRYRLDHGDQKGGKWNYSNERSVTFAELPAGDFRFFLSARSANGTWAVPKTILISIAPHWTGLLWVRLMTLALISGILIFVYKWDVQRKKEKIQNILTQEKLEHNVTSLELDVLRGQMNPHFVYNALNSIQKLVLQESRQAANKLLGLLARVLRSGLEYSQFDTISLDKEISFLNDYLQIEQHRFPDRFEYNINIDNNMNADDIRIPPLILQPICENAVKHAYMGKKLKLNIAFVKNTEESIKVIISDDGVGYLNMVHNKSNDQKRSLGLHIITKRIALWQKQSYTASVQMYPMYAESKKGTVVELILPCS